MNPTTVRAHSHKWQIFGWGTARTVTDVEIRSQTEELGQADENAHHDEQEQQPNGHDDTSQASTLFARSGLTERTLFLFWFAHRRPIYLL